jgi:hypothetical protein
MNTVLDYDAHCEKEEQEVPIRKEKKDLDTYNMIQGKLNGKVTNIMRQKDSLKLIAKGIKPLMAGAGRDGTYSGYSSPSNQGRN